MYEIVKSGPIEDQLMDQSGYVKKRRKKKVLRSVGYKKEIDDMNYYREEIMLYTNWRDEKNDILRNENFRYVHESKINTINSNKNLFTKINFDIESIPFNGDVDDDDRLDLETDEPIEELELDYDENELKADIGRDMDEYVGKEFAVFQIQNRLDDTEYLKILRRANVKQHDMVKHIMYETVRKKATFHYYITGPAGCGKSYLINILTETLVRLYDHRGSDPSSVKVLKLAPTGKAAYNIMGMTLHSAFGIPTKISKNMTDLSPNSLNEYRAQYKDLRTIIIDEISMVGYKLFYMVDQRLRQIMGENKPFGGVNVLAFGDFRQLPPVGDTPVYKIPQSMGMNLLSGNVLWNLFKIYELDEIMRQKDDLKFALCLNNLANGTLTEADVTLIEGRNVENADKVPQETIHLFFSNKEVDEFNSKKLLQLDTEGCRVEAIDSANGVASRPQKQYLLKRAKMMKRSDTGNLSFYLDLKISAKYMLIYNIRAMDGLVNGAMGTLRKLEYCRYKNSSRSVVKRIWIEFEDENVGKMTRKETAQYAIQNKINFRYTPIERMKKQICNSKNSDLYISRSQFPVQIAEAMTIHKSQGATYNNVAVNLQPNMHRNMMYVGFSRATKAEGLYVLGNFKNPVPPDITCPLTNELTRLREDPLVPEYRFLRERDDYAGIQFMYHNIQSIHAHFEDLLADPCFMQSDLILLAETWTIPSDYYEIPGFVLVSRIDSDQRRRKPSGVMIFMKEKLMKNYKTSFVSYRYGVHIAVTYVQEKVRFAVVYASPQLSYDDKLGAIYESLQDDEECKTVLVGDFNINFESEEGKRFVSEVSEMNLELRTNPKHHTTRGNTTIDAVFSNQSMRTDVYMSAYSYHYPLYGRIH